MCLDELGVGGNGPYATVEEALGAAAPGDVVQLDAGFFTGSIDLRPYPGVTLAGEGCARTTCIGDVIDDSLDSTVSGFSQAMGREGAPGESGLLYSGPLPPGVDTGEAVRVTMSMKASDHETLDASTEIGMIAYVEGETTVAVFPPTFEGDVSDRMRQDIADAIVSALTSASFSFFFRYFPATFFFTRTSFFLSFFFNDEPFTIVKLLGIVLSVGGGAFVALKDSGEGQEDVGK